MIFGDRSKFRELKSEQSSDRKTGFSFQHLATEFEDKMETENDSGIGRQTLYFLQFKKKTLHL